MKKNYRTRKASLRMKGWDYRSKGAYFITICTAESIPFFGVVEQGKMKYTLAGVVAQGFWYDIPHHFPHVSLGAFIVMPNHIHGIIHIDQLPSGAKECSPASKDCNAPSEKGIYSEMSPKAGSISTIIRSYKSVCTKYICAACPDLGFAWHRSFYDSVIRNWDAYDNISNYIKANPRKWEADRFYR